MFNNFTNCFLQQAPEAQTVEPVNVKTENKDAADCDMPPPSSTPARLGRRRQFSPKAGLLSPVVAGSAAFSDEVSS